MVAFACKCCGAQSPLDALSPLCDRCMLCAPCATLSLQAQVAAQLPSTSAAAPSHRYLKGEEVWYVTRDKRRVLAQILQVGHASRIRVSRVSMLLGLGFTDEGFECAADGHLGPPPRPPIHPPKVDASVHPPVHPPTHPPANRWLDISVHPTNHLSIHPPARRWMPRSTPPPTRSSCCCMGGRTTASSSSSSPEAWAAATETEAGWSQSSRSMSVCDP